MVGNFTVFYLSFPTSSLARPSTVWRKQWLLPQIPSTEWREQSRVNQQHSGLSQAAWGIIFWITWPWVQMFKSSWDPNLRQGVGSIRHSLWTCQEDHQSTDACGKRFLTEKLHSTGKAPRRGRSEIPGEIKTFKSDCVYSRIGKKHTYRHKPREEAHHEKA